MRKRHKIANMAFIFMLIIGVFLCQNIAYASDISYLRVPIGPLQRLGDSLETADPDNDAVRLRELERVLKGYHSILSEEGEKLLEEVSALLEGAIDTEEANRLLANMPSVEEPRLHLFVDPLHWLQEDERHIFLAVNVSIEITDRCGKQCFFCRYRGGRPLRDMPYPIVLKIAEQQIRFHIEDAGLEYLAHREKASFIFHPFVEGDPFFWRDDIIGANLADLVRKIKEIPETIEREIKEQGERNVSIPPVLFILSTSGWDPEAYSWVQENAEGLREVLSKYDVFQYSYHFLTNEIVRKAMRDEDVQEDLERLKHRHRDNMLSVVKEMDKSVDISLRHFVALRVLLPPQINAILDFQEEAYRELRRELVEAGYKVSAEEDDVAVITLVQQPALDRMPEALATYIKDRAIGKPSEHDSILKRLASRIRNLAGDNRAREDRLMQLRRKGAYADAGFDTVFKPNGLLVQIVPNYTTIEDNFSSADDPEFKRFLSLLKIILDTGEDAADGLFYNIGPMVQVKSLRGEPYFQFLFPDSEEELDNTYLMMTEQNDTFQFLRRYLPSIYPGLFSRIKSCDLTDQEEIASIFRDMKDIPFPRDFRVLRLDNVKEKLPPELHLETDEDLSWSGSDAEFEEAIKEVKRVTKENERFFASHPLSTFFAMKGKTIADVRTFPLRRCFDHPKDDIVSPGGDLVQIKVPPGMKRHDL